MMLIRTKDQIFRYENSEWVLCGRVTYGDFHNEIKDARGNLIVIQTGEKIDWF